MKIVFDTNVIIDIWKKDEAFFLDSFAAYDVCVLRGWEPYIAVTAVSDIEYLLGAQGILPKSKISQAMGHLLEMFSVTDAQECDCILAHASDMPDMKDGIIAFSAERNSMDAIITRNKKDFLKSPVPALTPAEFLQAFKPEGVTYDQIDFAENL